MCYDHWISIRQASVGTYCFLAGRVVLPFHESKHSWRKTICSSWASSSMAMFEINFRNDFSLDQKLTFNSGINSKPRIPIHSQACISSGYRNTEAIWYGKSGL